MYPYRYPAPYTRPLAFQRVGGFSSVGGVDGGECDAPVKITWPSDVDHLKARINTVAEATDLGVVSCVGLSDNEKKAWGLFITEWRKFNAQKTPLFGSHGEWVTACTYAKTLDAWRKKLEKGCELPGPDEIEGTQVASAAKWIAGAAIVIGGVVALTIYAPEIKSALRLGRK